LRNPPKSIAVIGCGISGLASAIFLARAGHAITLYEKFDKPASPGAGILLQPTGMKILSKLGLLDKLEPVTSRIDALKGYNLKGCCIMDVRYADQWPESYGLGVHRANLFKLLYETALDAGARIICGTRVEHVSPNIKTSRYQIICNQSDQPEFDAVVVADGTKSTLRPDLNIAFKMTAYPWGALWTICPDPDGRFHSILAQRYHRASKMIGVLPSGLHPQTGERCVSFFWSLSRQNYAAWQLADLCDWKSEVLRYWPEIGNLIEPIQAHSELTFAEYGDVVMPRWHKDGLVCIGDAAHGMSPQLGQGANLALIDAFVLNASIESNADLATAFSQYSAMRKNHLRFYQFASRRLTPMFQSNSTMAAIIRDVSFPLVHKIPFLYKQALRTVAGAKTGILIEKATPGVMYD
jgi:2-polyprenyl-6-methoxyphenol hydroxylase-like FAD-dependent oxidoreductase